MLAPAGETINFSSALSGGTIVLNRALGQIEFGENLTIDASMLPLGITISGNYPTEELGDGIRIFNITDPDLFDGVSSHVMMIGLTLTGGDPVVGVPEGGGDPHRRAA